MPTVDSPIGIFDSGMGGISVLAEAIRQFKNERFIYVGDSLNAPYGLKTVGEIEALSLNICEYMVKRDVKAIVVACNTATSAAVRSLRVKYDIPVIGMEPALKPAVLENAGRKIAVLATGVTLRETKFVKLSERFVGNADIINLPAPELVHLVEEGVLEGERAEEVIAGVFKDVDIKSLSAIVLGCTHFVFLSKTVKKVIGNGVKIYDGNDGTVKQLARLLKERRMFKNRDDENDAGIGDIPLVTITSLDNAVIENTLSSEMVERSKSLATYYLMNIDNTRPASLHGLREGESQKKIKDSVNDYLIEILKNGKLSEPEEKLLRFRYGLENVDRATFRELMRLMNVRRETELKKSIDSLDRKLFNYIKNRV